MLDGKTVVVIHPAWHSCGSYAVFCGQAAAYRALGARVLTLAVGTGPGQGSRNQGFWSHYYGVTADLPADERYHTGPSRFRLLLDGRRLKRAIELIRSDYATQMAGLAELSPLPPAVASRSDIALIHCNHYFNMPLALRLKALTGAPILLETHDVQARQYHLRGAKRLFTGRTSTLAEMEASELGLVAKADVLAHINTDELTWFSERLPRHKHVLLYPGLLAHDDDRHYFLVVASANYPNYLSVRWLLERVLPLAEPVRLAIVGGIDREFQARAPHLYLRHRDAFKGRVGDLQGYYDASAGVLLPVVAGHGLAIKTVEALQSGAPLIATPMAFRGMGIDLSKLENVRLADSPALFARHLDEMGQAAAAAAGAVWAVRSKSGSRKVFKELFSFPRYIERLGDIAADLLGSAPKAVGAPAPAETAPPEAAAIAVNGPYPGVALQ